MKSLTLVTKHLYFGLDPVRLRDAVGRVLSRVPEHTDRPIVRLDALLEDLQLSAPASRAVLEQMVASGVLQRVPSGGSEYAITDRFRELATAKIVEPLARAQAQMLVAHCAELAARFNRTALRNKYEIETLAVYGNYMSRREDLAELLLGVTGRHRVQRARPMLGRATTHTEGSEAIRRLFEGQSPFIEVQFFKHTTDVPRPFTVAFRADD